MELLEITNMIAEMKVHWMGLISSVLLGLEQKRSMNLDIAIETKMKW